MFPCLMTTVRTLILFGALTFYVHTQRSAYCSNSTTFFSFCHFLSLCVFLFFPRCCIIKTYKFNQVKSFSLFTCLFHPSLIITCSVFVKKKREFFSRILSGFFLSLSLLLCSSISVLSKDSSFSTSKQLPMTRRRGFVSKRNMSFVFQFDFFTLRFKITITAWYFTRGVEPTSTVGWFARLLNRE